MALPLPYIKKHIETWQKQLGSIRSHEYRAKWPKYLFRHEPLENAVQVIQLQKLLSRIDAQSIDHLDIAAPSVVLTRTDAHTFARLYFRPLNPTQYSVEGIRKISDLYNPKDSQVHAPVLVIFLFSASSVLSLPNTRFSNGNMQGTNAEHGNTVDFFGSIPFESVFHEGYFEPKSSEGNKILKSRCAEVLAESPLYLSEHLMGIRCRSEAERKTLLYLCGKGITAELKSKIKVYSEVGLFQSRFTYIKHVDLSAQGLKITLNPRKDSQKVELRLEISSDGNLISRVKPTAIDPAQTIRLSIAIPDGTYLITIWLENHLAYKATSSVDELPF